MRKYQAAAVNLYAHLLAERTSHKQAVIVSAGGMLGGKLREVHALECTTLDALMGGE